MLSWQAVEVSLLQLFLAVIRASNLQVASAVYHAVPSANTRLEMITEGLKVALPETAIQQEWKKLRKKIGTHAVKRNSLAHYTVVERFRQDGAFVTMYLSRSMFDSRDTERQEIDLRQLAEYERSFRQLGTGIQAFFAKVSAAGDASHPTAA
jgi:hypothetical protein